MRKGGNRLILLFSSTALVTVLFGTPFAAAQEAGSDKAVTPATEVSDVIVTAQKRSERLLSVAAPVTALTSEDLLRKGAVRMDDYAASVPGMSLVSTRAGQVQITLRGISTGVNISSTTSTYIDETPIGSSTAYALGTLSAPDLDPGSLQRIEVLRGPQGTLYGASSLGGLVKFVTRAPSLTDFGGRLEAGASSVSGGEAGYLVRGMVDGPLVEDKVGFSLSGFARTDPGFIDDARSGQKNVNDARIDGGRAALHWRPVDKVSVDLSALWHNSRATASSGQDVDENFKPIHGDLKQVRFVEEPWSIRNRVYSARINYEPSWGSVTSITSYQDFWNRWNVDNTYLTGPLLTAVLGIPDVAAVAATSMDMSKFTQELRVSTAGEGRLVWQGGLFFTHEQADRPQAIKMLDQNTRQPILPELDIFTARQVSRYTEYAAFGDVTYHVTPKIEVLAGVRYSTNKQHYRQPTSGFAAGGSYQLDGVSSDHSITYLFSPKYTFDNGAILYGRIASGYRPGGPNATTADILASGVPPTFEPDELTNYEIGYKASLLQRKLTLEASLFLIDWENIQIAETIQGISAYVNGSGARSRGVELAASWRPIRGLSLGANIALTDAELTGSSSGATGAKGDQLPGVARFAGGLSADYEFDLTEDLRAYVGASYHHQGKRRTDFVATAPASYERPLLPAYDTIDLRAGVTKGDLELQLYVKNLGDERGLNRVTSLVVDGYSAPLVATVIQPRTLGLSLSRRF